MKTEQALLSIPIEDETEVSNLLDECKELKSYIDKGFVIKQISAAGSGADAATKAYGATAICVVLLERVTE